jgi:hypothetical protein
MGHEHLGVDAHRGGQSVNLPPFFFTARQIGQLEHRSLTMPLHLTHFLRLQQPMAEPLLLIRAVM